MKFRAILKWIWPIIKAGSGNPLPLDQILHMRVNLSTTGADNDWAFLADVTTDKLPQLTQNNMNPGNYVFQLICFDKEERQSDPLIIPFIIDAPPDTSPPGQPTNVTVTVEPMP